MDETAVQIGAPRLAGGSLIEWTDYTFNPWWGCTRVSPACDHCYAERLAARFAPGLWDREGPRRLFGDAHWDEPLKWDRKAARDGVSRRVFCASMADVFEEHSALSGRRLRLWRLIESTPHLTWQLLTKRPQNVTRMVPAAWLREWPENVWLGTTIEGQRYANIRVPQLLDVPARVRFLSCEPLLEPLDLSGWLNLEWMDALGVPGEPMSFRGEGGWGAEMFGYMAGRRPGIHWVIAGGESGQSARPTDVRWVRDLRDQCAAVEVAFFFKQWGEWCPWSVVESTPELTEQVTTAARFPRTKTWDDGSHAVRVGKHSAGRELDGREWSEFPA